MAFAVMATQTHHCDLGCSLCDHADIHLVAYGLQLMDCLFLTTVLLRSRCSPLELEVFHGTRVGIELGPSGTCLEFMPEDQRICLSCEGGFF